MNKDIFSSVDNSILLIDKPEGITSFACINKVRKSLNIKKVGHSGTLDKFASGLLVVCTGKATKLTRFFLMDNKKYTGVVQLGKETETLDPQGKVISEKAVPTLTKDDLLALEKKFSGQQMQVPPKFSALKIAGKRASDYVRHGEEVEIKAREIEIFDLKIDFFLPERQDLLKIEVFCSKGTYIRSLARDLGRELGCGGYLTSLRRQESGNFTVNEALQYDNIIDKSQVEREKIPTVKPTMALAHLNVVEINDEAVNLVKTGAQFDQNCVLFFSCKKNDLPYMVVDQYKNLVALANINNENWQIKYLNVFC